MKKLYIFFLGLVMLGGCKKAIESITEDLVVKAMTNGQWKITLFTHNGANITTDFADYKFQYYKNKTVEAIIASSGLVERTGNWDGDASAMTTSAEFPGAPNPIGLINGIWKITNSGWTSVEATQTNGSETKTLKLVKL